MQPLEYYRLKTTENKSSFLPRFRFLPQAQRETMTMLCIFCRELDDVTDDSSNSAVVQATLNWQCANLAKTFTEQMPGHPINQALKTVLHGFALPHGEFDELIDGVQMDLDQARYNSFDDLKLYCHRAAGVVGCLVARIPGFTQPQTLEYADEMGLALQLTNIIRDVGEGAREGRIYLPVEDMQHFGIPASVTMRSAPTPEFAALMAFQIGRVHKTYRQAVPLLPAVDKKSQEVNLIMAAVYYTLLNGIECDGAEGVLTYKIAIPSPRKKRTALRTWLFGFRP